MITLYHYVHCLCVRVRWRLVFEVPYKSLVVPYDDENAS